MIEMMMMTNARKPGAVGGLPKNTLIDEILISSPIRISKKAMIMDAMFSAFPCPYGCSASGGFEAIFTANNITIEPTISEAECNASAIRARLPDMMPPTAFIIASNELTIIPIQVAVTMARVLASFKQDSPPWLNEG